MFLRRTTILFYFFFFLLLAVVIVWIPVLEDDKGTLRVYALDVGQGDGFLIEDPSGNQILIDGGPDTSILRGLGRYIPYYDKTIELIILTHPQADHLAGLVEVLKRYRVRQVLVTNLAYDSAIYREWERLLEEKNVKINYAKTGEVMRLGGGAALQILYPYQDFGGRVASSEEINNFSIIAKLVYGKTSMLFTGDSEIGEEFNLIRSRLNIASDILKIGHHGSKTSSSETFLEQVHPMLAVISVGRNNTYGHPNKPVLDRLSKLGITAYRTDILGDIALESNGFTWSLSDK